MSLGMESDKRKLNDLDHESGPPKKRVIGPSLPPVAQTVESQRSPTEEDDSESDSDDDFGPSLPPPNGASINSEQLPQSSAALTAPRDEQPESQRDTWMLHPPEQSDWAKKIDPTQLRNRKFQTGKSAGSASSKTLDSSWIETPEERIRRLGDEVMGVGPSNNGPNPPSKGSTGQTKSMEEKIKKFQDRNGKRTRLEKPQTEKDEAEDDPSKRAFDKEKDMGLSSKISSAQRRDMVNRASDYSSRFTKGEFL